MKKFYLFSTLLTLLCLTSCKDKFTRSPIPKPLDLSFEMNKASFLKERGISTEDQMVGESFELFSEDINRTVDFRLVSHEDSPYMIFSFDPIKLGLEKDKKLTFYLKTKGEDKEYTDELSFIIQRSFGKQGHKTADTRLNGEIIPLSPNAFIETSNIYTYRLD